MRLRMRTRREEEGGERKEEGGGRREEGGGRRGSYLLHQTYPEGRKWQRATPLPPN
jgi:hypothetical protein